MAVAVSAHLGAGIYEQLTRFRSAYAGGIVGEVMDEAAAVYAPLATMLLLVFQ